VSVSLSLFAAGASPGKGPDVSSSALICVPKAVVDAAPSTLALDLIAAANEASVDRATATPISDQFATRVPPALPTNCVASSVDAPFLYRMM
jgi:hypothetical protein